MRSAVHSDSNQTVYIQLKICSDCWLQAMHSCTRSRVWIPITKRCSTSPIIRDSTAFNIASGLTRPTLTGLGCKRGSPPPWPINYQVHMITTSSSPLSVRVSSGDSANSTCCGLSLIGRRCKRHNFHPPNWITSWLPFLLIATLVPMVASLVHILIATHPLLKNTLPCKRNKYFLITLYDMCFCTIFICAMILCCTIFICCTIL